MLSDNPYLFFICALGVFNCFLISVYFLIFERQKRTQNIIFGLLTLLLSIRVGKTVYMSFDTSGNLHFAQLGLSACFLIGVALYYYLKASLRERKSIPKPWILHFTALLLLIIIVGLIKPYSTNISFWHNYFAWFIYFVWGSYLLLSGFEIKKVISVVFKGSSKSTTLNTWLVLVFLGNVLIFLAYLIGYFWLYFVEMITFSTVFYTLMIFYLIKKDRNTIFKNALEKYSSKKIDSLEAEILMERLASIMEQEQLYRKSTLKLEDVAAKMDISSHKLSQLLNDNIGERFSTYVNRYRVAKAIQLLNKNHLFTLEAIGYEAGFLSKSGFYATFKRITGKTPSAFRNQQG